jgi:hypothetical protein
VLAAVVRAQPFVCPELSRSADQERFIHGLYVLGDQALLRWGTRNRNDICQRRIFLPYRNALWISTPRMVCPWFRSSVHSSAQPASLAPSTINASRKLSCAMRCRAIAASTSYASGLKIFQVAKSRMRSAASIGAERLLDFASDGDKEFGRDLNA